MSLEIFHVFFLFLYLSHSFHVTFFKCAFASFFSFSFIVFHSSVCVSEGIRFFFLCYLWYDCKCLNQINLRMPSKYLECVNVLSVRVDSSLSSSLSQIFTSGNVEHVCMVYVNVVARVSCMQFGTLILHTCNRMSDK